ncbi:MAG TPA: G1 family glutamic endopeptidase [Acidimicrobiales bacterium]|nr:G1 family glutamic endopeptidase [Acidimicrobiales bacterium]
MGTRELKRFAQHPHTRRAGARFSGSHAIASSIMSVLSLAAAASWAGHTVPPVVSTAVNSLQDSSSWSGYGVTGNSFTDVQGTFTVPSIGAGSQCDKEMLSEWVGIDGLDNHDLIQAGISELMQGGCTQDDVVLYAWWEILPAPNTMISSIDVSPGDTISVHIYRWLRQTWEIRVADETTGQAFSVLEQYKGAAASAEWIVEAPTLTSTCNGTCPLAPYYPEIEFSNVGFSGNAQQLREITMYQAGSRVSTPSALYGTGSDFFTSYGN